jgi:pyridoxamine 5'-phosphate oxidase
MSLSDSRRDYTSHALTEDAASSSPIEQFGRWFDDALAANAPDANAMTLATVSSGGRPAARTVLLKEFDSRGFTFYTNYGSAKGADLAVNPDACLLFFWPGLERQVRVTGTATRVTREESDQYFHSRPRDSQIAAWASPQSQVLPDRATLDAAYARLAAQYEGAEVPLPPQWGGYRVAPAQIEFWQGRASRLHDRLLYTKQADGSWSRTRLAP